MICLKDLVLYAMLTRKSPIVSNKLTESCLKIADKTVELILWNDDITFIQRGRICSEG